MPSSIQGGASVSPTAPVIPPAKAEWTVNAEAKNATAPLLGGVATIYRSDKDGKFRCDFVKPHTSEVDGEMVEGQIEQSIPLHDCPNLVTAQARAELMIRETLSKTHPDVMAEATAAETDDAVANAPEDPF